MDKKLTILLVLLFSSHLALAKDGDWDADATTSDTGTTDKAPPNEPPTAEDPLYPQVQDSMPTGEGQAVLFPTDSSPDLSGGGVPGASDEAKTTAESYLSTSPYKDEILTGAGEVNANIANSFISDLDSQTVQAEKEAITEEIFDMAADNTFTNQGDVNSELSQSVFADGDDFTKHEDSKDSIRDAMDAFRDQQDETRRIMSTDSSSARYKKTERQYY